MRTNHVKELLSRNEPALGAWLNLPSTSSARLMARLGFDWLLIDMEHTALHPGLVAEMIATIADAGTSAPFVRIPSNTVEWFKWALDAGAWGVLIPMVNSREEAQRTVAWSKYPPVGTRSIGGAFASYGFGTPDRNEYLAAANDEVMVLVQIESAQGLQNIDEILSVPGIDVAFVGPNDLHASLGLPPGLYSNEVAFLEALERIKKSCREHQVATGIMSSDGASAAERVRQGFQMVTVTTDINCMLSAATQNLHAARVARERL
ncbi:MAG TPA: aldolase/citrate lyase family protein [Ktedonobacteraceae bacterium]|jgi:4-hydroxy-2-oxoheptanedioate aldolase|nr:aldolase/citrate lyase family protein [Ktedonobacteraceae bacterium]